MNHPVVWTIVIIVVAVLIYWIINMQNQTTTENVKPAKKTTPLVIKQSSEIDIPSPASYSYSDVTDQSFSPPIVDLTPVVHIGYKGPNYIPRSGRNGRNYHDIPNPKYFKPNTVALNINRHEDTNSQ